MSEKISGRNPVLEALKANRPINKILIAKGPQKGSVKEIYAVAREKKIPIQQVERQYLNTLTDNPSHQGVLALAASKEYVEIEEIVEIARAKGEPPFVLLLDEIEDPHNLGALLRTADCAGVHGVVIPKRRAVGLTETVGKTSAGAIEHVAVSRVTNIVQTIEFLKNAGCWVVGADASAEEMYWSKDLSGPLAVVIGSEGKGISRLVKQHCDFLVKLPLKGKVSSLNASVAGSLLVYEILRQRESK